MEDEIPEPAPAPAPPRGKPKPEHVVNTGFADERRPGRPLSRNRTLAAGGSYLFWLEVGRPVRGSLERQRTKLPIEQLPAKARLVVVLYGFEGELAPEAETGELQLDSRGVRVLRPAVALAVVRPAMAERRLFFRVRAPEQPGLARMRCNIYCEGVLVQSRLVTAAVGARRLPRPSALRARLEYTLSRTLTGGKLASLPRHKLSIQLNESGATAKNVFVYSEEGESIYSTTATLDPFELQTAVTDSRKALRMASWGTEAEWVKGDEYRYSDGRRDPDRLRDDLARLAKAGYRLYTALIKPLAGGDTRLRDVVRKPGLVQIALKEARLVVPAALLYDARLFDHTEEDLRKYELCQAFRDLLVSADPQLERLACLHDQASCPGAGQPLVVCPSGFWGYRDAIGLPLSSTMDAPWQLPRKSGVQLTAGVAAGLERFPDHEKCLSLWASVDPAYTRRDLFARLANPDVQVIYLYCHGGFLDGAPCVVVGKGSDGPIDSAYLLDRVSWPEPGPLVFINGCHTAAGEPSQIYDLIGSFVENANAAGVIGTEISVFEKLACDFAEEFISRFVAGDQVGWAVRATRLKLLEQGNPLGLVYTPFVLGGLQLEKI